MSCSNYTEYTVNYCPDAFAFNGYDNEAYIVWEFTNLAGERVTGEAVTSSTGVLTLPVDGTIGLTKDMFQHFTGVWRFKSYGLDSAGNINPLVFCSDSQPYEYLVLTFQFVETLPTPNNIEMTLTECLSA